MYSSATVYGTAPATPSAGIAAPTQHMGTDDIATGWQGLIDPNNPLVWLGGLLLVTFGALAVAGSVRVGPVKASASVGSP